MKDGSSFAVNREAPAFASAEDVLAASPDAVGAVLSDIDGWPRWNPDVKQARMEGALARGTAFVWKAGPGTIHSVLQVVEAPRRIGWTGKTMGTAARHVWELDATDEGTRVRTEESWEGFVVRLLKPLMGGQLQKAMDSALQHLEAEMRRRSDE